MNTRTLFVVAGVLALVFGLGFLLAPHFLLGLYGTTLNDGGDVAARLYGKALLALAATNWLARGLPQEGARVIAAGDLINFALGAVITAWAFFAGIANALALGNTAAFAVLAIAFALVMLGRVPTAAR